VQIGGPDAPTSRAMATKRLWRSASVSFFRLTLALRGCLLRHAPPSGFLVMTVAYIAYIDESGDDGLSKVQPIDPNGASEWFVLGAIVVPAEIGREAIWTQKILTALKLPQRRILHFQPLDAQRQITACQTIAALPVRCFAVMSNKRNMPVLEWGRTFGQGLRHYACSITPNGVVALMTASTATGAAAHYR
jgi:hypothetical protein